MSTEQFHRLIWRKELRLKFGPKDDQRNVFRAQALVDIQPAGHFQDAMRR